MLAWLVPIGSMELNHRHKSLKDSILKKRFKTTMLECVKMKSLKTYLKGMHNLFWEKDFLKKIVYLKKNKFALFFSKRLKRFFFIYIYIYKGFFLIKKRKKNVGSKEKKLEKHFLVRKSFIYFQDNGFQE